MQDSLVAHFLWSSFTFSPLHLFQSLSHQSHSLTLSSFALLFLLTHSQSFPILFSLLLSLFPALAVHPLLSSWAAYQTCILLAIDQNASVVLNIKTFQRMEMPLSFQSHVVQRTLWSRSCKVLGSTLKYTLHIVFSDSYSLSYFMHQFGHSVSPYLSYTFYSVHTTFIASLSILEEQFLLSLRFYVFMCFSLSNLRV